MPTQVPSGAAISRKVFSVALFAVTQRTPTILKNLTGPAPKQSDAEAKLKGQSSADMPFVRVTDLSKTQGESVSVDMFNIIGGKPIVGDRNAEGKGQPLTYSSFDAKIELLSQVVDAGGKMAQQRTVHNLRGLAFANLKGYMPRLETQQTLVHIAGSRGFQTGNDWVVPLADDPDFTEIMVNPVKAPSYNRHYVVNGSTALTQGGLQLGSIADTDILRLEHLDFLRGIIDDSEFKLQPVKIADDPAADDEPMWVILVTARQWQGIQTNTTGLVWRTFLQNAWARKSHGSKHPLFSGEPGMWNGFLIKKMERAIRFPSASTTKIVTVGNRYTATETDQVVATLSAGKAVDRAIVLGAQAMVNVYGRNASTDYFYSWKERFYNFERNLEVLGEMMNGKVKTRFPVPNGAGQNEPTDHGVYVIDSVVNVAT